MLKPSATIFQSIFLKFHLEEHLKVIQTRNYNFDTLIKQIMILSSSETPEKLTPGQSSENFKKLKKTMQKSNEHEGNPQKT